MTIPTEAANILADVIGKPREAAQNVTRKEGEAGLIRRGKRGHPAPHVNKHELATMLVGMMAAIDDSTPTVRVPSLVDRIAKFSRGGDPTIYLMGDDQIPTAAGSYIEAVAQAIEGRVNELTGPVIALGLQFCRGEARGWVEWQKLPRVYFGVRNLPPGMIQEARIGADIIDALRQILDTSSVAPDDAKTTTPTQFAPESAKSSSESPCEPPFGHRQNMLEGSEARERKQYLDSLKGTDSPSANGFKSGESRYGDDQSHRCPEAAEC